MRWLADENFNNDILRGVLTRDRNFDIFRAQDLDETSGRDDVTLLGWATQNERVLLTHDLSTMVPAMKEHLRRAFRCAPIVLVPDSLPIGIAIEQILLLELCAAGADWSAGVIYLPLR